MCTAATYATKDHYFGRTLDYEFSYHEAVTITPRNYPFRFRKMTVLEHHYAIIGMAMVIDDYPLSPLHWMISDKESSLTVECVKEGLKIYNNPIGILTNNPPFDFQMLHLSNYMNLTSKVAVSRFSDAFNLDAYSRGMGAIGLPGDLSSASRFVKAAFTKTNSFSGVDMHKENLEGTKPLSYPLILGQQLQMQN